MNRHLNILDFTIRFILRGFSSHLAVMSIFIIVVFFVSSIIFTLQSLKGEALKVLSLSPEIIVQNMMAGRQIPIEDCLADKIKSILGVRLSRSRIWGYLYEPYSGANFTLWGLDGETIRRMAGVQLTFREGGLFNPEERGKIVVGEKIPEVMNLNDRKNITLTNSSGKLINFEISGIFTASSSLLTADLILMHEVDLREFFSMAPGMATDIVVSVANPAEIAIVALKISQIFPSFRTISRYQIKRTYESVFNFRSTLALYLLSGCLLAFLILLWIQGRLEFTEERKSLGVLKAIGWSTAEILEMKMMQVMIVGGISFFVGYLAGYLHVAVFKAFLLRPILFGWSVLYPTLDLVPEVSLEGMSLIFMLTVFPYVIVSLLPAWKSASVDGGALMRGEWQ